MPQKTPITFRSTPGVEAALTAEQQRRPGVSRTYLINQAIIRAYPPTPPADAARRISAKTTKAAVAA